jgi:Kef-type K+ transport system membrane component KefB
LTGGVRQVLNPFDRLSSPGSPSLQLVTLRIASIAALAAGVLVIARSGPGSVTWDPLAHFLIAAAVIVLLSHLLGAALRRFYQQPVVGEVIGGLLLGPSVLGAMLPGASDWLFDAATVSSLNTAAQLGLVVFLLLIGCESSDSQQRVRLTPVLVMAGFATLLPFAGGAGLAVGFSDLAGSAGGGSGYVLFIGVAISVTALPVLARIVSGLALTHTPVGQLALRTAATSDAAAWSVLAVVLATLAGTGMTGMGQRLGAVVALVLVAVLCVRPALAAVMRRAGHRTGDHLVLGMLLASGLAGAGVAQAIGLHPAVGAFLLGIVVPRGYPVLTRATSGLQALAVTVLLPIFFASIGLQVSIALLGSSARTWLLFTGIVLVAFLTKLAGGYLGGRTAGFGSRDSLRLGTLMNCRGVTELVVASIGYQHHLINGLGLTMLVLVAVLTTASTGPLLRLLDRGSAGSGSDAAPAELLTAPDELPAVADEGRSRLPLKGVVGGVLSDSSAEQDHLSLPVGGRR